jgi:RimJ/RimL family protein N-acetyltransferase
VKFVKEYTNNLVKYYDLGYRIIRKYWGKDMATENAIASLDYGFDRLDTIVIFAMADIENKGSDNVLTKIGLEFVETFDLNGIKRNWYKIEKEEWNKKRYNC